ncbi:hypothetical protein D910_06780 [Dendroctonus ponderosae]|uniref:Palmitoyl-protein thioesterase 1 n=1 Tax=Dendroctonus ponderosae TaxID=77166 RepID=U4U8Q1_DENPD|nr:hypothetical protein D910_06780 [Dendroctonus ponderosae]
MSAGNNFRFITCSVLLIFSYFAENVANEPTPIVMWHGMGDSCCAFYSLGAIKEKLNASIPGVYVHSLKIGDNFLEDVENGRALVQRCPTPRIKNLISVGGQHQGVYGLPNCGALSNNACDYIRKLLNHAAYIDWVQKGLVQATYWHDPLNEEEYKKNSSFLADINNELVINETYKTNLLGLENFVLIRFDNDTVVQPVDTEWFGFYKPGQSVEKQTLQESAIYTEDRLGLKQLNEDNRLKFLSTSGNHLRFEWEWFEENVVDHYLRN